MICVKWFKKIKKALKANPSRWEKSGLDATLNIGSCDKPDADRIFGNNL